MSMAVPIILAVSLAASLYGQIGWEWPNYQNEQNEKSKKSDEESSKEKSEKKKDESSSEMGKSGQKNKFGKASASKGRRDAGPKRQE